MFFYHFLQLCPRGHISKMLAVTVIKNTVLSAFGIFKSVSCLIRMRLRKNSSSKHVILSFSSTLSPRSYLENACCNRYQKHGYQAPLEFSNPFPALFECVWEQIFLPNMFFYHFLQLCPRGHISKMLAITVIKNTVNKRLWNFQIHFLPYSNAFEKKFFFQTCSFIIFFNFVPEVISRKCLL